MAKPAMISECERCGYPIAIPNKSLEVVELQRAIVDSLAKIDADLEAIKNTLKVRN